MLGLEQNAGKVTFRWHRCKIHMGNWNSNARLWKFAESVEDWRDEVIDYCKIEDI